MRRAALLAGCCGVLCCVVSCGQADQSSSRSGVTGSVVVDIGCPVLEGASSCPEVPLRARVVVLRVNSTENVAMVETGTDGRFRILLPPGGYELRGENLTGAPVPAAMPVVATVVANEFTQVTVRFDSGVRGPSGG